MSVEVTALVLRAQTGLNAQAKLVLIGLADHADVHGQEAWPSIAVLAHYAECSGRTVQRHLGALRDRGLIAIQRESGYRKPNVYELNLEALAASVPAKGDNVTPKTWVTDPEKGDKPSTTRVTNPTLMGDTAVSYEPPLEPNHPEEPSLLAPRKRDALFDGLAEACGIDSGEMTADEKRACGVAKAAILRASPTANAVEMRRRATNYRLHFAGAALTPSALARHWGMCARAPTNGDGSQHMDNVVRLAREMGQPV